MKPTSFLSVLAALLATLLSARAAFAEAPATRSPIPATSTGSPAEAGDGAKGEQTIPAGFHEETRPRKSLIFDGALAFGVPYTLSVVIGIGLLARDDVDPSFHSWWLLVPVVGPFATLPAATKNKASFAFFLTDGVAQATGAALIVSSVIWPRRVLVRNRAAGVALTPMRVGASGNGVGLVGSF
jgi:hypothetical protein